MPTERSGASIASGLVSTRSELGRQVGIPAILSMVHSGEALYRAMWASGIGVSDIAAFAKDRRNLDTYYRSWLKQSEKFAFPLAVVGSFGLPMDLIQELGIPVLEGVHANIRLQYPEWNLCDAAEPRMVTSLKLGAAVAWQNAVALKATGKETGFAYRRVATPDGVVIEPGLFYSPLNGAFLQDLRSRIDSGIPHSSFPQTEWVLIRIWRSRPDVRRNIIDFVEQSVAAFPPQFPPTIEDPRTGSVMTRRKYRENNYEDHTKR